MNIPYPEETVIGRILSHPVTYFFYGCYYGIMGIMFWQTQILTDYLIEYDLSPLIGTFVSGFCMMLAFLWGYGNLEEFKKWVKTLMNDRRTD